MTDNVKHSTSYFHEAIAHAFEMFKNGYEPVMETPFQPRRLGSAFVTEYKPVRESLDDFDGSDEAYMNINDEAIKAIEKGRQLTIQQKWEIDEDLDAEFEKLLEQSKPLPKELLDRMQDLRDKAEANREKEEGIFDRLVESIESAQSNPERCVSTIVEVDKERVRVYSKNELDEMHWNELKPILDAAGIRGRRRANLIRDFLKWQGGQ